MGNGSSRVGAWTRTRIERDDEVTYECWAQGPADDAEHFEQEISRRLKPELSELYTTALNLVNQCLFSEAVSKFQEAYNKSVDSVNFDKYANCRDACDLASKGKDFLNNGQFIGAKNKFNEACSTSRYSEVFNNFTNYMNSLTFAAEEGERCLNEGKFAEAKERFQEAYNQSNLNEIRNKFTNCKDACDLAKTAKEHLDKGEFTQAANKFQEAYNQSNLNEIRNKFANCKDACDLAKTAKEHLDKGEFTQAANKFQEAYNQSNLNEIRNKFTNCKDACDLAKTAKEHLDKGEFTQAANKFQEAYNQSNLNEIRNKFTNCKDACDLAKTAKEHLDKGEFTQAANKFQEAHNKSTAVELKNLFTNCKDASNLAETGLGKLKQHEFSAAVDKFNGAIYKVSTVTEVKKLLEDCKTVSDSAKTGLNHLKQGKFSQAVTKFDNAIQTALAINTLKALFTNIKYKKVSDIAKAGLESLKLGKFEEASSKFKEASSKFKEAADVPSIIQEIKKVLSDCKEAMDLADKGLACTTGSIEAYNNFNQAVEKVSIIAEFRNILTVYKEATNCANQAENNCNTGNFDTSIKNIDAAIKEQISLEFKAKLEEYKKSIESINNANKYVESNNFQEALTSLSTVNVNNNKKIIERVNTIKIQALKSKAENSLKSNTVESKKAAVADLKEVLELNQLDKQTAIKKSGIHKELQEYDNALSSLEKFSSDEDTKNLKTEIYNLKAKKCYEEHKIKEAIIAYNESLKIVPDDTIKLKLAWLYLETESYQNAKEYFDKLDSNNEQVKIGYAISCNRLGEDAMLHENFTSAIEFFMQAYNLIHEDLYCTNLGFAYIAKEEFTNALNSFAKINISDRKIQGQEKALNCLIKSLPNSDIAKIGEYYDQLIGLQGINENAKAKYLANKALLVRNTDEIKSISLINEALKIVDSSHEKISTISQLDSLMGEGIFYLDDHII